MKKYDCKNWTMNDIAHAMKGRDSLGRTIVIPMFQRGKRWKKDQRNAFIDSLLQGFPVGTLLFAEQADKTYSVIDGLQRCSTICEYILNPTIRDHLKNVDPDVLEACRLALYPDSKNITIDDDINEKILNYISSKKTFDEVESLYIAMTLCRAFPSDQDFETLLLKVGDIIGPWYKDYKKEFESICATEIPVIVYTGESTHLNEIFKRINREGLPLNDYEIYAATWPEDRYPISKDEIVDYVIKKYDCLALDDYNILAYDSNAMRKSKELTTFEFLFGFGKYIVNTYDFLNLDPAKRSDEVSTVSFEIVDACFHNSKKIGDLANELRYRGVKLNLLARRIEEAIKFVRDVISPICDFRGNQREKRQFLHSKYFAISLVAFVFREMYDVNDLSVKKDSWDSQKDSLARNILHHYVFEIVQNTWHAGGVGIIYTSVKDRTFAEDISLDRWNSLLNNYFESSLMNRQTERIKNPTNIDKLLLNCIYADVFTVKDNSSMSYFDIEHIATKDWMKTLMRDTKMSNGLAVSHIANLCYLPASVNRKKKAKTIYEDTSLTHQIKMIEEKYSFTERTDLDFLYEIKDSRKAKLLDEKYTLYLRGRFEKQKQKIFAFLGVE